MCGTIENVLQSIYSFANARRYLDKGRLPNFQQRRDYLSPVAFAARIASICLGYVDKVWQPYLRRGDRQECGEPLLSPTAEPDVDRVPLSISLMHITPRAPHPKYVQHAVHELAVIMRRTRFSPRSAGRSGSTIRNSASVRSPRAITVS